MDRLNARFQKGYWGGAFPRSLARDLKRVADRLFGVVELLAAVGDGVVAQRAGHLHDDAQHDQ